MTETRARRKRSRTPLQPAAPAASPAELGSAIVAGVYQPDELVPGEIELGRRYGASRTVVREAFKLLSAKGLIASRKRAGTRARPREAWHTLDADVLAWRLKNGAAEPKFVFDLLHARAVVEPAAAAMAARSHTPQDLAAIEAAFADMERAATRRHPVRRPRQALPQGDPGGDRQRRDGGLRRADRGGPRHLRARRVASCRCAGAVGAACIARCSRRSAGATPKARTPR